MGEPSRRFRAGPKWMWKMRGRNGGSEQGLNGCGQEWSLNARCRLWGWNARYGVWGSRSDGLRRDGIDGAGHAELECKARGCGGWNGSSEMGRRPWRRARRLYLIV
eukprot:355472-Chlamydomonas_euryale.AAC.2